MLFSYLQVKTQCKKRSAQCWPGDTWGPQLTLVSARQRTRSELYEWRWDIGRTQCEPQRRPRHFANTHTLWTRSGRWWSRMYRGRWPTACTRTSPTCSARATSWQTTPLCPSTSRSSPRTSRDSVSDPATTGSAASQKQVQKPHTACTLNWFIFYSFIYTYSSRPENFSCFHILQKYTPEYNHL